MDTLDFLVESTVTDFHFDRAIREMRIEVSCQWEDKPRRSIVITGIDDFVVDDLREYNIIDRVRLFGPDESVGENGEFVSRLFFLMQKRAPTAQDLDWPVLKEKFSSIGDRKLTLMEIEPVCGLSMVLLATNIRIEAVEKPHPEFKSEGNPAVR